MDLVTGVYRESRRMPREEQFALTNQMRRAAVSIPANIAEGEGRVSKKEFGRFLSIAHGSLRELETHLMIAERLEYLTAEAVEQLLNLAGEVGRLITGLLKSLRV